MDPISINSPYEDLNHIPENSVIKVLEQPVYSRKVFYITTKTYYYGILYKEVGNFVAIMNLLGT